MNGIEEIIFAYMYGTCTVHVSTCTLHVRSSKQPNVFIFDYKTVKGCQNDGTSAVLVTTSSVVGVKSR